MNHTKNNGFASTLTRLLQPAREHTTTPAMQRSREESPLPRRVSVATVLSFLAVIGASGVAHAQAPAAPPAPAAKPAPAPAAAAPAPAAKPAAPAAAPAPAA